VEGRDDGTRLARPLTRKRPRVRTDMVRDVVSEIWREGNWHCEVHTRGTRVEGRLFVYFRDTVATAESVRLGLGAATRAEILRLRVIRGHLLPPK
jgi:hypothetical protein